jgi:hypothetical protein
MLEEETVVYTCNIYTYIHIAVGGANSCMHREIYIHTHTYILQLEEATGVYSSGSTSQIDFAGYEMISRDMR